MRLVCISDTHGLHRQISVPDGDILLHAGDLTTHGRSAELLNLNRWLGSLPHQHKIVIAGNHDFVCEAQADQIAAILSNAIYLCDQATVVAGLTIYGSPWTPSGRLGVFAQPQSLRRWLGSYS